MLKKISLLIFGGAILFLILLLSSKTFRHPMKPEHLKKIDLDRINSSKKVNWKKISFSTRFELKRIFHDKWPQECKTDSKDNLYVFDIGDYEILKFDSTGKFIKKWGRRGHGPGEFNGIVRFMIDQEDQIWITDTGNHRLLKYNQEGVLIDMIKFTSSFSHNTVILSDSTFVVPGLLKSPLMRKYSYNGKKIGSFGSHLTVSHLMNQGRCIVDAKDRIYYSYDFASPILIFSANGELLNKIDGPVKISPPLASFKNINYQLTGYEKFATLYMCIYDHYLFVLFSGISPAHPAVESRLIEPVESDIIHVYDIELAKYLYTFKIPVLAKYIHVNGPYLYCVSENPDVMVIKYKML